MSSKPNPKPATPIELRPAGALTEIWKDGQQIGMIEPWEDSIRIVLGDADPGGGLVLAWGGEPLSLIINLTGGL